MTVKNRPSSLEFTSSRSSWSSSPGSVSGSRPTRNAYSWELVNIIYLYPRTGQHMIKTICVAFFTCMNKLVATKYVNSFLNFIALSVVLSILYMTVAEWREFSFADRTTHAQIWLIFCLALVLAMVLEFALVYVLFGTLRTRLRSLCGGTTQPDDMEVGVCYSYR